MKIGIMFPEMPVGVGQAVPYAEIARRGGHRLWFGHSTIVDSHLTMAALAARGYALSFGSAVALFPLWHPHGFAVQALSIARLTGQTYVAGMGPGGREFQQKTLGHVLDKPVSATTAFALEARRVIPQPLQTNSATPDGQVDPSFGSVEFGFGVLRPAMARAVGRVADWSITWLTPERYIRETLLPTMRAAATEAGRVEPRLATVLHVGVKRPNRIPEKLAFSAVGAHLRTAHYTSMLQQAGVMVDPAEPESGAKALVRNGVYIYGGVDDIVAQIESMHRTGANEVVLNMFGVAQVHGYAAALEDLQEILSALDSRARQTQRAAESATAHLPAKVGSPGIEPGLPSLKVEQLA
jgi:alkanesulfonate monooxygenase SsuD/methylene tetrahydromethanopterin reductase-like flavin-dependent oxidoreductase (luciferase family)